MLFIYVDFVIFVVCFSFQVPGAGHNDVIEKNPDGYLRALTEFIAKVQ
jgi:hypothetical protein